MLPDGTVVYSDRAPSAGDPTKLEFRNLPASPLPESALKFRADIEKTLKARSTALKAPVAGEVRLFTAQWCPHCRRAKAHLSQRGIAFTEFDIDTPDGMAAYIHASGRGVPLLVANSGRLEGFSAQAYDRLLVAKRRP